jgi:hypothetical protein
VLFSRHLIHLAALEARVDTKRFLAGTIAGGIVLYVVGYLIFTMAVASFYAANAGTATGVARPTELVWAVLLGNLGYAALICYAMGTRTAAGLVGGAKIGAVVGFLMWFSADFILYGAQNVANLTRTIVDPLLEIIHGGIGGAVIGLVVARMKPAA